MKKILGYGLVGIVLAFLVFQVYKNWYTISSLRWEIWSFKSFLLIISALTIYLSNIFSWHILTKALGLKIKLKENARIWISSNLTRLIPGGIWQYPSRVYLLTKIGISKKEGIMAITIEGFLTLGIGALIVLITLPYWVAPNLAAQYEHVILTLSLFPLVIFLLLYGKSLKLLSFATSKLTGKDLGLDKIPNINIKWALPLFVSFALRFFTLGITLFLLISVATPLEIQYILGVIGIFSLSWIIGYMVFIAPGGLGAADLSLALFLSSLIPFSISTTIALSFRLLVFVVELLTFLTVQTLFNDSTENG